MRYFILIYTATYFFPFPAQGLYQNCGWENYFAYSLVHANFFHLIINMYSLYLLDRIFRNRLKISFPLQILLILLFTFLPALLCNTSPLPTYGCSAVIYGLTGYWAVASARIAGYRFSFRLFLLTMTSFLFTLPLHSVNTSLHFTAFSLGCTVSGAYSYIIHREV